MNGILVLSIVRWIGVWISASRREDLAAREFLGSNASRISLAENSSARILRCKIVGGIWLEANLNVEVP